MPRCRWEEAACVEGLEHASMMEGRPKVGGVSLGWVRSSYGGL